MIMEGLFERYPHLKVVMIECGFGWLPALGWRLDKHWKRMRDEVPHLSRSFADYAREHFYVTTSGAFSNTALQCTIAELGVEKIMFSVDWPFMSNMPGRKFMDPADRPDECNQVV